MTRLLSILCAFLIGSVCLSGPVAAQGISGVLNDQFGAMATTTSPGAYMGARRGVITGGSIHVRSRSVNPGPLLQLTSPSLKTGGCGDIDGFAGSFSFISGQELTALLRQIASNAGTYAFSLALSSMCAQCSAQMDKLQSWIQKANALVQDSCTAAQNLVDGGIAAWNDKEKELQAAATGVVDDPAAGQKRGLGESAAAADLSDEELKELDPGNLIWRTMKNQDISRWVDSGDDELLQDIMSYVGTVIVCTSDRNGCDFKEDSHVRSDLTVETPVTGPLHLNDLVYGSARATGDLNGRNVTVLRCLGGTAAEECLQVEEKQLPNFEGMSYKVLKIVNGSPGSNEGMIGRIRTGASPSMEDRLLINNAQAYTSIIVNLARRSEFAARSFAESFSAEIAVEITRNTLDELLGAVRKSTLKLHGADARRAAELLADARSKLHLESRDLKRSNASSGAMLQYYLQLSEVLPPSTMLPLPGAGSP